MTRNEIKEHLHSDIEFSYNGKWASFCPIGVFLCGYQYEDEIPYKTIDDAIDAKVFDGKSLVEIWDEVLPQITYQEK